MSSEPQQHTAHPFKGLHQIPRTATAFLLRYIRLRWRAFAALIGIVVGAAVCAVAVQYGMKLIVDAMAQPERSEAPIWHLLGWFIGLIAVESALWRIAGVLGCRAVVSSGVDIRLDLFAHLSAQPLRFFGEHLAGSLGARITSTASAAGALYGNLTWRIAPPIVDLIVAIVVFLTIDPPMAAALAGFVVVVALVIVWAGISGRGRHQHYADRAAVVQGELIDVVGNIWTVKAFSARHREQTRLQGLLGDEANAHRASWLYLERVRLLHDLFLLIMAGAMLAWAIELWRRNQISAGDVVVVSALTFRILHGSRDLALSWVDCAQHVGTIATTLSIIGQTPTLQDGQARHALRATTGAVECREVRFAYDASAPILDGLNLRIEAGTRVGIVGPSGSGKTTLLALLQRLVDVQAGQILIDGTAVTSVTQDSLRMNIAVVPQEVVLFHRSVMDNVRYGRADASDAEVLIAIRQAQCEGFVQALPEGVNTLVGERGVRLSGGQRQRIGVARALLKPAPLLLLDEATSALDSALEKRILEALTHVTQGRTVVAVAHRLSSLAGFDRVIVMIEGQIVEDGPPEALRRAGGAFSDMWTLQLGRYGTPQA